MREKEEKKRRKQSSESERKRAKALREGVSRANVMQECQLQMEWGIYSPGHHGSCMIGEWPGLHHEGWGWGSGGIVCDVTTAQCSR